MSANQRERTIESQEYPEQAPDILKLGSAQITIILCIEQSASESFKVQLTNDGNNNLSK